MGSIREAFNSRACGKGCSGHVMRWLFFVLVPVAGLVYFAYLCQTSSECPWYFWISAVFAGIWLLWAFSVQMKAKKYWNSEDSYHNVGTRTDVITYQNVAVVREVRPPRRPLPTAERWQAQAKQRVKQRYSARQPLRPKVVRPKPQHYRRQDGQPSPAPPPPAVNPAYGYNEYGGIPGAGPSAPSAPPFTPAPSMPMYTSLEAEGYQAGQRTGSVYSQVEGQPGKA